MADFDNTNRGVLFKNEKKEKDTHPDYRGNINVGGVEYWLDAWIKTGAKGKFMSLSVKPKEAIQAPKQAAKPEQKFTQGSKFEDLDDMIPF